MSNGKARYEHISKLTELDVDRVKGDGVDDSAEISIREWALRRRRIVILLAGSIRVGSKTSYEGGETSGTASFNVKVDTRRCIFMSESNFRWWKEAAYPSRIASPNGRVLLEPPRKIFQIVSANC